MILFILIFLVYIPYLISLSSNKLSLKLSLRTSHVNSLTSTLSSSSVKQTKLSSTPKSSSSSSKSSLSSEITSSRSSTLTIGQAIAQARSWIDILESSSLLILPGEETLPHHYLLNEQRRRQLYGLSSLKKIVQFLIGTSNYQKQQQLLMNNDDRYYRILKASMIISPKNNDIIEDLNDFYVYCDVIKEIVTITDFSNNNINSEKILNDIIQLIDKVLNFVTIRMKDISSIYIDKLHWSLTRLYNYTNENKIKDYLDKINSKRISLKLPFIVLQNTVTNSTSFEQLLHEVPFKAERLNTINGKQVLERRETCWMAENNVGGLAYSGKIMVPVPFCDSVRNVRDAVELRTGHFFDCCLINYYPDGESACKFHSDPDMGTLWARDTVVVSFGETRRFHFRPIININDEKSENEQTRYIYRLFEGDIVYMFDECQDDYQHAVMKGDNNNNNNGRISIVFKKSIPGIGGRRGHGIPRGKKDLQVNKSIDKKKK